MKELAYAGVPIGARDDQLCLTHMWRAAGSDPGKRPAEWARLEGPQEFIGYVADSLNMGHAHIWISDRGQTGATWAHWQIGLAYAKYLSPEFHMYCNEVVRAHMERRHKGAVSTQVELKLIEAFDKLFDQKLNPIHEKLDRSHKVLEGTDGKVIQLIHRMDDAVPRKEPSAKNKRIYLHTVTKCFAGCCPCGCRKKIVDDRGNPVLDERQNPLLAFDHWYSRERNAVEACWPVHRECNEKLKDDDYRRSKHSRFVVFHEERKTVQHNVRHPSKPRKKRSPTSSSSGQGNLF